VNKLPNWKAILDEVKASGSAHDVVRRKYLDKLHQITDRNIIVYYSGWLQKGHLQRQGLDSSIFYLNDSDKNGFMATINALDRSKGLDLLLHTPGGSTAATESLVDYLRAMFGTNIRAIIPQLAMSAGTMIACSCKEIIMGKHSSLGPIDPQISGVAAHGIIEEFTRAGEEIKKNQAMIPLWQPIIAKYTPTLIGECEKSIKWSNQIVKEWLLTGMFEGEENAESKADKIISVFGSHALTKSHDRHISMDRAKKDSGLNIIALENDNNLQDAVLTVHHACIQTLSATPAYKIIENHLGVAYIETAATTIVAK
jgi:ATP-dependent protease ClpP protease subunit